MENNKMKTSYVAPGMVVAKDIYSSANQLIVPAGTELTDSIISRLKLYSVSEIPVTAAPKKAAAPAAAAKPKKEPSYVERVKESPEFKQFSEAFYTTFVSFKDHLNNVVRGETALDTDIMLNDVSHIVASCKNPSGLLDMMMCIRNLDDSTYVHSMNVALLCKLFAVWTKLSEEDSKNLILAGLLHDMGKMLIPPAIIKKPAKLTDDEYNTIKNHPMLGYNILKGQNVTEQVRLAALQHHERADGLGYPSGLMLEKIDSFARMVAIADVYDALTAARVYRGPICPLEVIGIFQKEGLTKYDPRYLMIFLEGIMHSYLNHTVRLSNGETGRIIMMHRNTLSRPVVYISDDYFIDLSKNPDITVLEII